MATASGAGTNVRRITPAEILAYLDPASFDPQDAPVPLEFWLAGAKVNVLWDNTLIEMEPAEWDEVQVGLSGSKLFPQEADGHRDDPPPDLESKARQVVTKLLSEADVDRFERIMKLTNVLDAFAALFGGYADWKGMVEGDWNRRGNGFADAQSDAISFFFDGVDDAELAMLETENPRINPEIIGDVLNRFPAFARIVKRCD